MVFVLCLQESVGQDSAVARGTITGLIGGGSIMTVTWRFDPLFLGDQSRVIGTIIVALLGAIVGDISASAGELNPDPTIPGPI